MDPMAGMDGRGKSRPNRDSIPGKCRNILCIKLLKKFINFRKANDNPSHSNCINIRLDHTIHLKHVMHNHIYIYIYIYIYIASFPPADIAGGKEAEAVCEQGAEENVWT